jgi:hypothetical protein
MGSFAIDKVQDTIVEGAIQVGRDFMGQFTFQAPQVPEKKVRMSFRNLQSLNGSPFPNVEMYIDPQQLSVRKKVMTNKRLTKGGWVTQFWGHDLTVMQVKSTTGNFQPMYGVQLQLPPDLGNKSIESWFNQVRERWVKGGGPLKIFEKIKTWVFQNRFDPEKPSEGLPLIELAWEGSFYEGYFTAFDYNMNSTQPFNINYNFSFIVIRKKDTSLKDIFGSITPQKLLGDPVGTISNTLKQTTDVAISAGKKELNKLSVNLPLVGEVGAKDLGLDDLPDKITLW